jgi:hypothetical protein
MAAIVADVPVRLPTGGESSPDNRGMTTSVDIEEIEATKSEKFLAVVLAAFLLIGTIWFYVQVDGWVREVIETPQPTTAQQAIFDRRDRAEKALDHRNVELENARQNLELAREAYRTELDAHRAATKEEAVYRAAESAFTTATAVQQRASSACTSAIQAAKPAGKAYAKRTHSAEVTQAWVIALVRLGFVVGWLLAALRLVNAQRRRQSRFLPLGFAAAGAGVITALVYATDYITDYIDPLDLGPIVLSAAGAAATIGAFVGLQRWLARRIPARRVRNGECPFCGHPVRSEAPHCEGCGREVIASCAACAAPRHVGSAHCGHCGQA